MSKLLELFLSSILIALLSVALVVFSMLHYIVKVGGIVNCAWHGSAKAWLDSNADGLLNNGERPLRDVEILIDDVQNKLVNVGWTAITDQDGEARLNVVMLGCSEIILEVYANIPDGYRLTTESRIEVNQDFWGMLNPNRVYYFGFIFE